MHIDHQWRMERRMARAIEQDSRDREIGYRDGGDRPIPMHKPMHKAFQSPETHNLGRAPSATVALILPLLSSP